MKFIFVQQPYGLCIFCKHWIQYLSLWSWGRWEVFASSIVEDPSFCKTFVIANNIFGTVLHLCEHAVARRVGFRTGSSWSMYGEDRLRLSDLTSLQFSVETIMLIQLVKRLRNFPWTAIEKGRMVCLWFFMVLHQPKVISRVQSGTASPKSKVKVCEVLYSLTSFLTPCRTFSP